MSNMKQYVNDILDLVSKRDPDQAHFKNTVEEVLTSVVPLLEKHPEYKAHKILERMIEPERVISFRVPWVDDKGEIQVNRGYRVQMSSAMGPYKGGLRFHPSVSLDILKFLAFEQVFKNALTGLPIGGGKGQLEGTVGIQAVQPVLQFGLSLHGGFTGKRLKWPLF